jgi:hypothetical protein
MSEPYYPRHGEQSPDSDELHIAWLEDRIEVLEALLVEIRDVASVLPVSKYRHVGEQIDAVLKAGKP